MIGFRILQGIGGAFVTANSGAVISDLYPPERRGRAYGYNSIGFSLGAVLGIVLGGAIVTYVSWRWIFWINVPIGIAAVALAARVLRDRGERARRHLDMTGMVTLGLGLFGVLWAMTKLATSPLDASVVGYLAGGVVFLALFVVAEQRQREPMLDLSLLKIPGMAPSLLAALFQGLANFAVLFLVIMYLQGPRGLSPLHASLLLVPGYVIGSAVGPPTNLDHIFMLFEFRCGQEMQASRLAAKRASPSELREIEAAVQACRHGLTRGDNAEFERGDDAFHRGVASASHNFFLVSAVREARMLQRQASVIGISGVGGHAEAAIIEHEAIYSAIRDGDPDAAAQATSVHLDKTLEDYRREIQRRVFG